LAAVKKLAIAKRSLLTDEEFQEIVRQSGITEIRG
jgi:hypothetical protein